MRHFFTVVLLITFLGILTPTYGQWQPHIIDEDINLGVSVDVADMIGDTKPELIVTNFNGNELILYQKNFPYTTWTKYIIAYVGAGFAWSADIDSDDTLDVVASLYSAGRMVWYENNHPDWIEHIIDSNTDHADFMLVADFDNDDRIDVVTGGFSPPGDVIWYENNHPDWIKHIIDANATGTPSLNVTDFDGDSLLDLAVTMVNANKVVWYRNENNGQSWRKYTIDDNLNNAFGINSGDIDGDGKMDIVATTGGPYFAGSDVVWYKNNLPDTKWTKHIIDANLIGATWPYVTDVDGDDTMDVIVTGYSGDVVVWYENNHPTWTKDTIHTNLNGPRVFAVSDVDGDEINDVIVPALGSVVWYKNPYTTVAYCISFEVYPKYIPPQQGDTLKLIAQISNPENHQITVHALIQGNNSTFNDSLQLFDDGLHFDENPNDNIYGNAKWLSGLEKGLYKVDLFTHDLYAGTNYKYYRSNYFTTIGPVVVDTFEILEQGENFFTLKYNLRNDDLTDTVTAVTAIASTTDTNVTNTQGILVFGDIAPGQVKSHSFFLRFYTQNNPSSIDFTVHIFSNSRFFWSDSFTVSVPTGIAANETNLPTEFALKQNYPNPFNPVTTINYQIPELSFVTLKVYDVLGREITTLVNEEKSVGSYEVEFDATSLPSGIYFYRLQAGSFAETKKMVLMK